MTLIFYDSMIPSTIFLSFPSPALLSPFSYLHGLGFLRAKKPWTETFVLENRAQERKATIGFCWVVFCPGKKCGVDFRALLLIPGNVTGKAAGPEGGAAQGLHEPELPWTFAACSGQGLAALWKILGLLCPSDLLIRVVDGDFSRRNLEQLKGDRSGIGDDGDAVNSSSVLS